MSFVGSLLAWRFPRFGMAPGRLLEESLFMKRSPLGLPIEAGLTLRCILSGSLLSLLMIVDPLCKIVEYPLALLYFLQRRFAQWGFDSVSLLDLFEPRF